jgi:hypothetical protein
MDLTHEEKKRGIRILTSMRLNDFITVIDRKKDELDEKVELYMKECIADYKECKSVTPHEIDTAIELHKAYAMSLGSVLIDMKELCKKNLNKDYMVPTLLIETFMEVARKTTVLKYVKMQPSHDRIL